MARGKETPGDKKELAKSLIYLNPDMSLRDVAKESNLSHTTVYGIKQELMDDDGFLQYRTEKKKEQIVKALDIASKYIDHLGVKEVIAKASARDSAIVAGTMIDKAQLLAGEPTQITESHKSITELKKDTEQLLQELKSLTG